MKRTIENSEHIGAYIPGDLMRNVRLLLLDPTTGKIKYRGLSNLITQLLTEWVEKQRTDQSTVSAEIPPRDRLESYTNEGN